MMSTCKHGLAKTASCQLCAREKEYGETVTGGEAASHYPTKADEEGDE